MLISLIIHGLLFCGGGWLFPAQNEKIKVTVCSTPIRFAPEITPKPETKKPVLKSKTNPPTLKNPLIPKASPAFSKPGKPAASSGHRVITRQGKAEPQASPVAYQPKVSESSGNLEIADNQACGSGEIALNGTPSGDLNGVPGSYDSGNQPAAAPEPEKPLIPPRPIYAPQPEYPRQAKESEIEGNVYLKALVSEKGEVLRVEILSPADDSNLNRAAENGVRSWKFQPARRGESPVASWVKLTIKFKLE